MTVFKARSSLPPLSRLHEMQSNDPADFPVPTSREEEGQFTPLRPASSMLASPSAGPDLRPVVPR
jgi:hypothetical protein